MLCDGVPEGRIGGWLESGRLVAVAPVGRCFNAQVPRPSRVNNNKCQIWVYPVRERVFVEVTLSDSAKRFKHV